jgi:hypothetical protein
MPMLISNGMEDPVFTVTQTGLYKSARERFNHIKCTTLSYKKYPCALKGHSRDACLSPLIASASARASIEHLRLPTLEWYPSSCSHSQQEEYKLFFWSNSLANVALKISLPFPFWTFNFEMILSLVRKEGYTFIWKCAMNF